MANKKRGFTLIELLAVIVILGLLMAIAIPSVTKYITQSRKKTVTTTIGNYIGALTNQVNDMEYVFTEANTVYAVPIECISLERGGTDPFGEWMQANDSYWAYVLVQYDDSTSSYTYGFTFKDSAGYGLYPTTTEKLNESGKQINTGLDLTRPSNGTITNITAKANWTGFDLEDDTKLIVLEAESEGETGNGQTTCTLCQKGKNYDQVEEESKKKEEEKYINETTAYAIYSEDDQSLTFFRSTNEIKVGDIYEGKTITNVYTGFENTNYGSYSTIPWDSIKEKVIKVVTIEKNKPISTAKWFKDFSNCTYMDLTNLDTSNVKNMASMFTFAGKSAKTFTLLGLDKWNTARVTNMSGMFGSAGNDATTWNIGDLSNWDTSNVTDMNGMFSSAGRNATIFNIGSLDNWDTSKVTNMRYMFGYAGYNATTWNIGDLSNWDISNVTNICAMFTWAGYKVTTWSIGDLSNWDTSNVTDMSAIFTSAGYNATTWNIGDLSNWDTSNVTDMNGMFASAGYRATTWSIGDLSNWDISKVTNIEGMFASAGYNATTWNIGDLSNWDTSNVTRMRTVFMNAGRNATYLLDCSNWTVDKVTNHDYFNYGVSSKVKAPTWK